MGLRPAKQDLKRESGALLLSLVRHIEEFVTELNTIPPAGNQGLIQFRGVARHVAICQLLGPNSSAGQALTDARSEHLPLDDARQVAEAHQKLDGRVAQYLEKRTMLELAFAAVKARGLLSIGPLVTDRAGRYFDLFMARRQTPRSEINEWWNTFTSQVGLREDDAFPDFLLATDEVCKDVASREVDTINRWDLRELDLDRLANRVLRYVANPASQADRREFSAALAELKGGTEIEVHSRDDRVCSKAFVRPARLRTRTALSTYTRHMLSQLAGGEGHERKLQAVSETGEWLDDDRIKAHLAGVTIEVLVAFPTKATDLGGTYEGHVTVRVVDPWRHNRHMTIVSKRSTLALVTNEIAPAEDEAGLRDNRAPSTETWERAIYFARRQRTPYVTPVYLEDRADVGRLRKAFEVMWPYGEPLWPPKDAT